MTNLVDVVVQQRTAALDRPLTYSVPAGLELGLGDVVRVPLGPRELYGFVVAGPRSGEPPPNVRAVIARAGDVPAFDAAGLALARWIAEHYCCSLAEALGPMIYGAALPRAVDRFVPSPAFETSVPASIPSRLTRLIAEDLREGFSLDALLRHPEARRAGDRRALLRALSVLVRSGALARSRTFAAPRMSEAREKYLEATGSDVRGPRVRAIARM